MPGHQSVRMAIDGPGTRHVAVLQEESQGAPVHLGAIRGMGAQGRQLRGKEERPFPERVVEGLDSQPIPGEQERSRPRVEKREGKHSHQAIDDAASPRPVAFEQDLGVGPRTKHVTSVLELAAEFTVVVDLAVVAHRQFAARIGHRLVAGFAEVEDRQPRMPQCQGIGLAGSREPGFQEPLVVRSPVAEGAIHVPDRTGHEPVGGRHNATDPAHGFRRPILLVVRGRT